MRYVVRARWNNELEMECDDRTTVTVYEPDPIDTGLVDRRGDPIMRVPDPIGFVRRD